MNTLCYMCYQRFLDVSRQTSSLASVCRLPAHLCAGMKAEREAAHATMSLAHSIFPLKITGEIASKYPWNVLGRWPGLAQAGDQNPACGPMGCISLQPVTAQVAAQRSNESNPFIAAAFRTCERQSLQRSNSRKSFNVTTYQIVDKGSARDMEEMKHKIHFVPTQRNRMVLFNASWNIL